MRGTKRTNQIPKQFLLNKIENGYIIHIYKKLSIRFILILIIQLIFFLCILNAYMYCYNIVF